MTPIDIISRLYQGLEDQYNKPQPDPNFIVMVRMLLCSVGVTNNESTMGLLSRRELHFAKAVYTLLGGSDSEKLEHVIDYPAFVQRLSRTQMFRGCPLDDAFIGQYAQKCGVGLWSSIPKFPNHWVSGLSENALYSLRQLWDDTSTLSNPLVCFAPDVRQKIDVGKPTNPRMLSGVFCGSL
ncbi:hypothetical protein FOCG_18528 [Fusarium oxysporum f. sp. radicis-lycopersici 26381]|nr:hypothetical protein FOCG_18528 [Fusarium oxysporum f. sp. radicis-lycopersici 26381]